MTDEVVKLAEIRDARLSVDRVLAAVANPAAGAQCVFIGTVRDVDQQRAVRELSYHQHPLAQPELARVCREVAARHDLLALAAVHRIGELVIGDIAVIVAASSGHREAAFAAARDLIDTLKSHVPIWKKQSFCDGDQQWVGLP